LVHLSKAVHSIHSTSYTRAPARVAPFAGGRKPFADEPLAARIVQHFPLMRTTSRTIAAFALIALFGYSTARGAPGSLYRIELPGNIVLFAKTPPVPHGTRLVFARYPDGAVMSLKQSEVRRVVVVPVAATDARKMKPGELLVLGPTGGGAAAGTPATGGGAGASGQPGEGPGGKALLNPSRDYRPDWDAKQVPGMNLPYPASARDYREGFTMAYPPASAAQAGPGQPPTGVASGNPPKSPQ
jgi:hypothetical protein